MRVVAENSDTDIARRRAKADFEAALCELTSNLIRVVRGAGKAHIIVDQAVSMLNALTAIQQVPDTFFLAGEVRPMLSVQQPWDDRMELSTDHRMRQDAEEQIISGALQVVASRLVGQKMQVASGMREMLDGCAALEHWRAEARAEIRRAAREAARPVGKSGRRTAKKPNPWDE